MIHIEIELQKLKNQVNEMGSLVGKQIKKCIIAFVEMDKNLAKEVKIQEKRVNAFELKIDRDCENIFALQNPVAGDLRLVFATLKVNYNLERIGDNAEGIAQYVMQAQEKFDKKLLEETRFQEMADNVLHMLNDICTAYATDDTKLARTIFQRDSVVDEINKNATEIIAKYITENHSKALAALYLLTIIRKLERTGDHITNIAEEVIFYVEGKVLKHGKKDIPLEG